MSDIICADKVGIFHYTLRNLEGELLDSSEGGEPLAYLHGHDNIVLGLESELEGKKKGDAFQATVAPAKGYGEVNEEAYFKVHRKDFPKGQYEEMEIGTQFHVEDAQGNPTAVWVSDKQGAWATLTSNHPLAGITLVFDVEVVAVRDALPVELDHHHPHGIDGTGGHHHH